MSQTRCRSQTSFQTKGESTGRKTSKERGWVQTPNAAMRVKAAVAYCGNDSPGAGAAGMMREPDVHQPTDLLTRLPECLHEALAVFIGDLA